MSIASPVYSGKKSIFVYPCEIVCFRKEDGVQWSGHELGDERMNAGLGKCCAIALTEFQHSPVLYTWQRPKIPFSLGGPYIPTIDGATFRMRQPLSRHGGGRNSSLRQKAACCAVLLQCLSHRLTRQNCAEIGCSLLKFLFVRTPSIEKKCIVMAAAAEKRTLTWPLSALNRVYVAIATDR
ncbi:hypothetical protein NPIL_578251 [Nephila pilipes]|uniref:Uncharacterized protein n=1 Tax=Nephila pilipes TaxID=299642 RepID=A0A8X6TXF9_NEPPI|nr:hypothetical protein NPIL_578251 [Nephila pilipes]